MRTADSGLFADAAMSVASSMVLGVSEAEPRLEMTWLRHRLLPDGLPPEEMQGVRLITADGQYDDDLYNLEQEQRLVLRTLARAVQGGHSATGGRLEAEHAWRLSPRVVLVSAEVVRARLSVMAADAENV